MKPLLSALPLTFLLAGCGSPGADGTAATDGAAIVNEINAKAVTKVSTANKPDTGKPDDRYRVVDEAQAGMPAEVAAALKEAKTTPPPADMNVPDTARVRLTTSKGPITVELDGKAAPLHVKSFLYLAGRGFFNDTVFHRFAELGGAGKGGIIQGGDPLTKKPDLEKFFGQGGPGYQIPRERNDLKHDQFVLAAARTDDPDSAGSQFYITLDTVPHLDQGDGYTVFGKVVEGQQNALKLRQGDGLKSVVVLSGPPGGRIQPRNSQP